MNLIKILALALLSIPSVSFSSSEMPDGCEVVRHGKGYAEGMMTVVVRKRGWDELQTMQVAKTDLEKVFVDVFVYAGSRYPCKLEEAPTIAFKRLIEGK